MSENKNFDIVDVDVKFEKRPVEDIIKDSQNIDAEKISSEVLVWLNNNVENFIDNQVKMFKLDLVLDNVKDMEETKKLQDLYRAVPDDEEADEKKLEKSQECRRILDQIVGKSFKNMKESKDLLKQLFDRMIFYYERIIPSPENKKRAKEIDEELKLLVKQKDECACEENKKEIQQKIVDTIKEGENLVKFEQFQGAVNITNFDYEAFNVGVKIIDRHNDGNDDSETKEEDRKILKQYTIPEGFTVWLEIVFKHKQRPTAMF